MATGVLILNYVGFESSYDQFHLNRDRVYRITHDKSVGGEKLYSKAQVYMPMGPDVVQNFSQVEAYTRLFKMAEELEMSVKVVREDGESLKFKESEIYMASEDFFRVFSFDLLQGDPITVLKEPKQVAISNTVAKKYFGETDPINKIIDAGIWGEYRVTGVFEDVPRNSHLQFDMLFSWNQLTDHDDTNWSWDGFFTYLLLKPDTEIVELEQDINLLAHSRIEPLTTSRGISSQFYLQPLQSIHLHSDLLGEAANNGSFRLMRWLSVLALVIMAIAWINFMNLSSIKNIRRTREVGIRKIIGATPYQLHKQFFVEAFLLNSAALALASLLVTLVSPVLETQFNFNLQGGILSHPNMVMALLVLMLLGTVVSGWYPSIFHNTLQPVGALKNRLSGKPGLSIKHALVVFQLVVSIILITGLFALNQQLKYMKSQDLGIDVQHTLVVTNFKSHQTHDPAAPAFLDQLRQFAQVNKVSLSSSIPGYRSWMVPNGIRRVGSDPEESVTLHVVRADKDYLDLYQADFLSGVNFFGNPEKDHNSAIISERALKMLGFRSPTDAIGKTISAFRRELEVIGVVQNYHSKSLKEDFEPLIFLTGPGPLSFFSIKLNTGNPTQSLALIKEAYINHYPDHPFDYFFLDEYFNAQYQTDEKLSAMIGLFAGLAIFIGSIGLFGLSVYMMVDRTKEIGIRKVLGASVIGMVRLISKHYLQLLLIAGMIAIPISYWIIKNQMANYTFAIEMNMWLFVVPIMVISGTVILTISAQTVKAALANPVDSLRNE